MFDTVPTEVWWHVAKRCDDLNTLFTSWALVCKTFHDITQDNGVFQYLVLYTLDIPDHYYEALKSKGQWFEIIKRWHQLKSWYQLKKCHEHIQPCITQYEAKVKAKALDKKFKHVLCSVCYKPTMRGRYTFVDRSSFYIFQGSFICCTCAGDNKRNYRKVITLEQIQLTDGDKCAELVKHSDKLWHRLASSSDIDDSNYLITMEDYEFVLFQNMLNSDIIEKHVEVSHKLHSYDEEIKKLMTCKEELTKILDKAMNGLAEELNTRFDCQLPKPYNVTKFNNIITDATNTVYYLKRMKRNQFPVDDQIHYFKQIKFFLLEKMPKLERLERNLYRFETVPSQTRDNRIRFRKKKIFWYRLLKRRGLLKCSALLIDGKHRCSLRTDGFHELCSLHRKLHQKSFSECK